MQVDIAKNVLEYLDIASEKAGKLEASFFRQEMRNNLSEAGIGNSPLEQLFWISANLWCKAYMVYVNPEPWFDDRSGVWKKGSGVQIQPQTKIGKYKVDFCIEVSGDFGPRENLMPVIVELDGHDFHDKDKHQRAYEKARDRFLTSAGYRVLHYTGSEVVKDPMRVCFEAMQLAGVFIGEGLFNEEYKPEFLDALL